MKIGLSVVRFDWPGNPENTGKVLAEIAARVDEGFDSLWVMDHFFQIDPGIGSYDDPMLEAYSTLHYMAAFTKRVKLGVLVTGVNYRKPALLVKEVTTLDVLTGGRAYFGIGAGWYEHEALGLGFDYPPLAERFERLEETLQIAKHMWSGNREAFEGKYSNMQEPVNSPQPLSKPHPPILIGGSGEKKTLRMVAQYADASNIFGLLEPEVIQHKYDVLKQHCDELGRNYDEIEKSTLHTVHIAPGKLSAADMIAHCKKYAAVGVNHMIFNMPVYHDMVAIDTFLKEIIPAVKDL